MNATERYIDAAADFLIFLVGMSMLLITADSLFGMMEELLLFTIR